MNNEEIKNKLIEILSERFPGFEKGQSVGVRNLKDGSKWAGYSSKDFTPVGRTETGFDLNLSGDICYVLDIRLKESERGAGLGWSLYEAAHEFAREMGYKRVRQTPSGGFFRNGKMVKSRKDYLLERGYKKLGGSMVEFRV